MTIYDPPLISAAKSEWLKYLNSLDPQADKLERDRVLEFMAERFDSGLSLTEYAVKHIFAE